MDSNRGRVKNDFPTPDTINQMTFDMGTLSATINGHPATFDGWTWSLSSDPAFEDTLNFFSKRDRYRGQFIDDTANKVLSLMPCEWAIVAFTRTPPPPPTTDPNIRQ